MKKHTPCLLLYIVAFFSLPILANPENAVEFHKWFSSELNAPGKADSIVALENYITTNNGPIEACNILDSWYRINNQRYIAITFYSGLTKNVSAAWLGHWRLARFLRENRSSPDSVYYHISTAIKRATHPTTQLIYDFIRYSYLQNPRITPTQIFNSINALTSLKISKDLILALNSYYKSEYRTVVHYYNTLALEEKNDPFILEVMGYIHQQLGDNASFNFWEQAIERSGELGQIYRITWLQARYGNELYKTDIISSKNLIRAAVKQAAELAAPNLIAITSIFYSDMLILSGDYESALAHAKTGKRYAEELGSYRSILDAMRNLAYVYAMQGQYKNSYNTYLKAYDTALEDPSIVNRNIHLQRVLLDRSHMYIHLKLPDLAKADLKQLKDIFRSTSSEDLGNKIDDIIARLYLQSEEADSAIIYLQGAIKGKQQSGESDISMITQYSKLAEAYLVAGMHDQAESFFNKALTIANTSELTQHAPWYHLGLARIAIKRRRFTKALQILENTVLLPLPLPEASATLYGDENITWHRKMLMGDAYLGLENYSTAIPLYQQAAKEFEISHNRIPSPRQKRGYFKGGKEIYERLALALFYSFQKSEQNVDTDSLLQYMEFGRLRSFKQSQQQNISTGYADSLKQQKQEMETMRRELRQMAFDHADNKTLGKREDILSLLEAEYTATNLIATEQITSIDVLTDTYQTTDLQNIASILRSVILQYQIHENGSFIFATTADTTWLIGIAAEQASIVAHINRLVSPWLQVENLNDPQIPFYTESAYWLYKMLIKPVEEKLGKDLSKRLLIIPDDELNNLPFRALIYSPAPQKVYNILDNANEYKHLFLLNRYIMNVLPSLSLLTPEKQPPLTKSSGFSMLIGPNTDMGELKTPSVDGQFKRGISKAWSFEEIFSGDEEKEAIRNITTNVVDIPPKEITEKRLLSELRTQDLVHLTMHGFKRSQFETFEGLVVAPGAEDDGLFLAHEIEDDSFNARMVFVNACETISRTKNAGEGLIGLPRELLRSGISSVIVTRWQVFTGYSKVLTPRFYEQLLSNELPPDSALTLAQRELISKPDIFKRQGPPISYEHPYFWAPYVMYGKPVSYDRSKTLPKNTNTSIILKLIFTALFLLISVFLWRRVRR